MFNIKHLKIQKQLYNIVGSEVKDRLDDLSKVNIFVGANNSGKSRFMRSIFYVDKKTKVNFLPNDEYLDYFLNQSELFKQFVHNPKNRVSSENERQAFLNIDKNLDEIEYFLESETPYSSLIQIFKNSDRDGIGYGTPLYYCKKIFNEYFEKIKFDDNFLKYNFYKIYIPSLRGLIPLIPKDLLQQDNFQDDFYAERIKQDYFGEKSDILVDVNDFLLGNDVKTSNAIISGLQFYEYVKNYLLGDLEQREMIRKYENYLSETFFENQDVVLIPKINDDVLTIKIGEEEHKIYDLGDGIQSIILLTLPLFLYLKKSKEENTTILVFIEEPEVNLHPKLQRILLNTLLSPLFEDYQFFITTHSNHFIDRFFEKEDISIYSFDKKINDVEDLSIEFTIENVGFNHFPTLKRLGALPSSILSHNSTILVEGSTDKEHYSLYFELYQQHLENKKPNYKRFIEGIHYSFSRGGGSETIESVKDFNEIEKERIFFISDNDSEEETTKKKKLFSKIRYENYYILDVKEVENLITVDAVISIIQQVYNVSDRRINKKFDENEYYSTDNFYNFIVETILKGKVPDKFPKKKSKLKDQLSRYESNFTNNFEDLTDDAKKVAIEIYKFVKKNNPKL